MQDSAVKIRAGFRHSLRSLQNDEGGNVILDERGSLELQDSAVKISAGFRHSLRSFQNDEGGNVVLDSLQNDEGGNVILGSFLVT